MNLANIKDDHLRLLIFVGNLAIIGVIVFTLYDTFWVPRMLDAGKLDLSRYLIPLDDKPQGINPDEAKVVWEALEPPAPPPPEPVKPPDPGPVTPPEPKAPPLEARLGPRFKAVFLNYEKGHSAIFDGDKEPIVRVGTDIGEHWSEFAGVILEEIKLEEGDKPVAIFFDPKTEKRVELRLPEGKVDERVVIISGS